MSKLVKVQNSLFGTVTCDYYGNGKGEFFMTRQQIGQALEYKDPQWAIDKIHHAHKDRLDKFSVTTKLVATDGKAYDTFLYSAKGVYEICRWSRQPKADAFYDHVYDILEGLRLGYLKLEIERQSPLWQQTRSSGKNVHRMETDTIQNFVAYAISQGSLNADRYYTLFTQLANKTANILPNQRDNLSIKQLSKLSFIESMIESIVQECMDKGMEYHAIYKECKNRMLAFKEATKLTTI